MPLYLRPIPSLLFLSLCAYVVWEWVRWVRAKRDLIRSLRLTGWILVGLSAVLFVALELSSRWEQAKTPGEKNMGVAALSMAFGIPMVISGLAGLLCLIVSILMFVYRRFCSRISN
jgi:hypothetical protein